jgi:phenylacetate-CoA ligase
LLVDEALRGVGATVVPTGPGNTELQISMITALNVSGFVGQPSYLMTILDKMDEMGIPREAVTIKKALFSAEPYTPSQQARFEGEYGMKTTSAYGTADLGFVGYTRQNVQGFCLLDSLYVEIADPTSGEPVPLGEIGEIVVTTFNKAYPLLRFGTGDLGALAPQSTPECGGGQQLLGLYGRSGDAIKVRGMFLHPNQLLGAKMQFPQIKHIQAIITRPANSDYVALRVELHDGADGTDLPEKLKELARVAVRLRIDEVELVESGEINPSERTVQDQRDWD